MTRVMRKLLAVLLVSMLLITALAEMQEDWALTLVDRDHPLPENYAVTDLVDLKGGQQVDRRIYPALQAMFDAARAAGCQLFVRSGYRTRKKQEQLLYDRYKEYLGKGYTDEAARAEALKWVAWPGTSEHEAGLGVDINASSGSSKEKVYAWLAENAWRYGFILRYPEDKIHITGINNEPWHYRYVGTAAAEEMKRTGLCLEEYLVARALADNRPLIDEAA